MIWSISSDPSLPWTQHHHRLRMRSEDIPLCLSIPWSWVNPKYSIHQVQHHPQINSLPLPASFSSLGRWYCTKLSTFPQLQVNQWIESPLPSRIPPNRPPPSTSSFTLNYRPRVHLYVHLGLASKYISKLARSRMASTCFSSLNLSHMLLLQTRSITSSMCISESAQFRPRSTSPNLLDHCLQVDLRVYSVSVSNCMSKLAISCPPSVSLSSLNLGLQFHLHNWSITASKCISKLAQSRPPSKSQSSLNLSLQLHLKCRSITASKCISTLTLSWPPSHPQNVL